MRTDIKFTYKEYAALPETGPRYQLVHGEMVMSPSPDFKHQTVIMNLANILFTFVKQKKLGYIRAAPLDVVLDDENVFQPDILYISNARKDIITAKNIRGAPDLCVEVLSLSNRDLDLETKRVMYARAGVAEYWIADPAADTVAIYRLQENPREPLQALRKGDVLESTLFPGLKFPLEDIFND